MDITTRRRVFPRELFDDACAAASADVRAAALVDQRRAHAMEVAGLARELAPVAGVSPDDAFAAGLLHDLGELLLLARDPERYGELLAAELDQGTQLREEKALFGTDHPLLAAEHLLELRLPDVIADAVADHHDPILGSADTTMVVAAADELLTRDPAHRLAIAALSLDDHAAGWIPEPS